MPKRREIIYPPFLDEGHSREPEAGYSSPMSPSDLTHARTHEELAGRPEPPLAEGVSFNEPLLTTDYWRLD